MKQVVIENPVINSPFQEPQRHFKFLEEGITDEIIETRWISSCLVPIPQPRKKHLKQLSFDAEWTARASSCGTPISPATTSRTTNSNVACVAKCTKLPGARSL